MFTADSAAKSENEYESSIGGMVQHGLPLCHPEQQIILKNQGETDRKACAEHAKLTSYG
jgi:hypothetical protein